MRQIIITLFLVGCGGTAPEVGPCFADSQCRADRICHEGACRFLSDVQAERREPQTSNDAATDSSTSTTVEPQETEAGPEGPRNLAISRTIDIAGARILASPTHNGRGLVGVAASDGTVVLVNALTGALVFRVRRDERIFSSPVFLTPDLLVVGTHSGNVIGFGPDGAAVFERNLGAPVDGPLTRSADGQFVLVPAAGVHAIDRNGQTVFQVPTGGNLTACIANLESAPESWIVPTVDGRLVAFGRQGVRWEVTLGSSVDGCPAIAPDGTIYVGTDLGELLALSAVDRSIRFRFRTEGPIRTTPTILPNGVVVFGSDDRHVYGVASDGSLSFRVATEGRVRGNPWPDRNGRTFVGSQDNRLYVITANGTVEGTVDGGSNVDTRSTYLGPNLLAFGTDRGQLIVVGP